MIGAGNALRGPSMCLDVHVTVCVYVFPFAISPFSDIEVMIRQEVRPVHNI